MPSQAGALAVAEELLAEVGVDPCEVDPKAVAEALIACDEAELPEEGPHPCGEGWPAEVGGILRGLDELLALGELADAVGALACGGGTDVHAAIEDGLWELEDETADRATRLVVVSDLEGGADPQDLVDEAGERFVGTTLLGITAAGAREVGRRLAAAPGGLYLDADPAEALYTWDLRFDALLAPTSFGLEANRVPKREPMR